MNIFRFMSIIRRVIFRPRKCGRFWISFVMMSRQPK